MNRGCREQAELFAIGALESEERARFEEHFKDCPGCRAEVLACQEALARMIPYHLPRPKVWNRISDFIEIPKMPIDVARYSWEEVDGGVRLSVFREDFQSGVRGLLMWTRPELKRAAHHHCADEEILVLSGVLRIGEQAYSIGEMCHVRAGTEHIEMAVPGNECLYVVVHRSSERPIAPKGMLDPMCHNCAFREVHEAIFQRNAI